MVFLGRRHFTFTIGIRKSMEATTMEKRDKIIEQLRKDVEVLKKSRLDNITVERLKLFNCPVCKHETISKEIPDNLAFADTSSTIGRADKFYLGAGGGIYVWAGDLPDRICLNCGNKFLYESKSQWVKREDTNVGRKEKSKS
jgi:hypothetical protein